MIIGYLILPIAPEFGLTGSVVDLYRRRASARDILPH
jgi:hypothetical protein